jgi:hypothetical protein
LGGVLYGLCRTHKKRGDCTGPASGSPGYEDLRIDPHVTIIPMSNQFHEVGINLYTKRPDKDWSLTDCVSFLIMQKQNLKEAATTDHHFEQAGFARLI